MRRKKSYHGPSVHTDPLPCQENAFSWGSSSSRLKPSIAQDETYLKAYCNGTFFKDVDCILYMSTENRHLS